MEKAMSDETPVPSLLTPGTTARVIAKLNVRDAPTRSAKRTDRLEPGVRVIPLDSAVIGESVFGNNRWYKLSGPKNEYIWSGGVEIVALPVPALTTSFPAPVVSRRANGTILPLKGADLKFHYGDCGAAQGAAPGTFVPDAAWQAANLVQFPHKLLIAVKQPSLQVHKLAQPYFQAAFDEIDRQGLGVRVVSCSGTYVPRFIRSPTATVNPVISSHAWGVAIDLNESFNGQGAPPALPGATGSLRELVPIFAAYGFAWGGDFSTTVDGMHFELARTNF